MDDILVITEHRKHELAETSLEMLSKGRSLADSSGGRLVAVVIGGDIDKHAEKIAGWADEVLAVHDNGIEDSLAEPYQRILYPIIKELKPRIVLIGHSAFGIDLAPALAVELESPLAADCIDISLEDGGIFAKRSIHNGKVNAIYSFVPSDTIVLTGRPGQFAIEEVHKAGVIQNIDSSPDEKIEYKAFERYIEPEVSEEDISKSDILVSVGRGMKSADNLAMARELAEVLEGRLSCSRPVVDQRWLPSECQVGLSGKTVKPKLYLALGISGAFQHVIGMHGSEMVVAVNSDPNAPIFSIANYGIIDDVLKVVPALLQEVKKSK